MTREEALKLMWESHNWPARNYAFKMGKGPNPGEWRSIFMWAELTEPVEMHEWNGWHPVKENTTNRTVETGTMVLVTVYSRFGDVGIRARNLDKVGHGYDARVDPEILINWERANSE